MRAFITGASRGIGYAITTELAQGLTEATILSRDPSGLSRIGQEIKQAQPECKVSEIACDLGDLEQTRSELARWKGSTTSPLDLVVLVAGTYTEGTLGEISIEDFERDLRVNLTSSVLVVQHVLPALRQGVNPRIIIIGSTAAYEDYPLVPSYGVAKWGLRSYASNLRTELRPDRIGVTFLSPGGTLTDMWAGEEVPPGRLLEPTDIARLVKASLQLSPQAVVEELIVRPIEGDIHE
ncbi:MAG: SDR family oxidoreductase [Frankia sp.]|nr:SDR family oxidoreductase [Frankia sp.]